MSECWLQIIFGASRLLESGGYRPSGICSAVAPCRLRCQRGTVAGTLGELGSVVVDVSDKDDDHSGAGVGDAAVVSGSHVHLSGEYQASSGKRQAPFAPPFTTKSGHSQLNPITVGGRGIGSAPGGFSHTVFLLMARCSPNFVL